MISDDRISEISTKLQLLDKDLYADLGKSSNHQMSPSDAVRRGIALYKNIKNKIQPSICTNDTIKQHFNDDHEKVVLISSVADLVSGLFFEISPITVAVLLVKEGLNSYCAEFWTTAKKGNE
jgi:hypothetical protein